MSRLIDAEELKKRIHCLYSDDLEILEKIDEQPTAFDVEKVVEQLESLSRCSTWNHNSDNIDRNAAIEIVKRGGRDEK